MAELRNRMEMEADFARSLARLSSKHRKELIDLLGTPPDPTNIPPGFWQHVEDDHKREMTSILILLIMAAGEQHAGLLLPDDLRAVAVDAMRDDAEAWATGRAATVSRQYVERSQAMLSKLPVRWYGPDFQVRKAFGELKAPGSGQVLSGALEIFGPVRDARIATTETTKAATAGTNGAIGAAGELGVSVSVTWWCEADGRECPYCGALHRQNMKDWEAVLSAANAPPAVIEEITANGGPTAHANCRCWLETKVVRSPVPESFDPAKHPRDEDGKFSRSGSSGGAGISQSHKNAIADYSTDQFRPINDALRGKAEPRPGDEKIVAKIDDALQKLPKHEGLTFRQFDADDSIIDKLQVGMTFSDPAFFSTSKDAPRFIPKGKVALQIVGKSGADISGLSHHGAAEKEVLFPRNTKFKVLRAEQHKHGGWVAILQEVG